MAGGHRWADHAHEDCSAGCGRTRALCCVVGEGQEQEAVQLEGAGGSEEPGDIAGLVQLAGARVGLSKLLFGVAEVFSWELAKRSNVMDEGGAGERRDTRMVAPRSLSLGANRVSVITSVWVIAALCWFTGENCLGAPSIAPAMRPS
jgi:hypothetical protein